MCFELPTTKIKTEKPDIDELFRSDKFQPVKEWEDRTGEVGLPMRSLRA